MKQHEKYCFHVLCDLVFNVSKKIYKNMHAAFMKLGLCVLISNIVKIDILLRKIGTRLRNYLEQG